MAATGLPTSPGETLRRAKPLLGTLVGVEVRSADPDLTYAATHAAFDAIHSVHRLMSFHDEQSDISRINRAAPGVAVQVDARTALLLRLALEISVASHGAFDCTVGSALVQHRLLPAFGDQTLEAPFGHRDCAANSPGFRVEEHAVVKERACIIDVGGIAKGYAVDLALDAIASLAADRGASFDHVLINAGGDLRHWGNRPATIQLRDPRRRDAFAGSFELLNGALATSATSGLAAADADADTAGVPSALFDPDSRSPLPLGLGATVHAPTCAIADALTKVALVTRERSHPIFDRYGATVVQLSSGFPPPARSRQL